MNNRTVMLVGVTILIVIVIGHLGSSRVAVLSRPAKADSLKEQQKATDKHDGPVKEDPATSRKSSTVTSKPEAIRNTSANHKCAQLCPDQRRAHSYPSISLGGFAQDFVSYWSFRDNSEHVLSWPLGRYSEKNWDYNRDDENAVASCLVECPVIFIKADEQNVVSFMSSFMKRLTSPFILVTSASDYSSPTFSTQELLESKRLIKWFTMNPNRKHLKLHAIPIGINIAEHANPLLESMQFAVSDVENRQIHLRKLFKDTLQASQNNDAYKLMSVNFGDTHLIRQKLREVYCNKTFCSCVPQQPTRVKAYAMLSAYTFWLSPRGNGLDCHRTWEALYLGRVPVVQTSTLDSNYHGLPVMIVDDIKEVTHEMLTSQLRKWENVHFDLHKLHSSYWSKMIDETRAAYMTENTLLETRERRRCWGPRKQR